MTAEVVTYEPDNCLKHGYLRVVPEILRELWQNRWLAYQIFRRDFTSGFKQSFGGFAYLILGPLVSTGMFLLLNQSGVFNLGDISVPYPIFSVAGSALWGLFSGAVTAGPGALLGAGAAVWKPCPRDRRHYVYYGVGHPCACGGRSPEQPSLNPSRRDFPGDAAYERPMRYGHCIA